MPDEIVPFKIEPPKLLHRQSYYDHDLRWLQETSLYRQADGTYFLEQETTETNMEAPGVHFKNMPLPPKARVYFTPDMLASLLPHLVAIAEE